MRRLVEFELENGETILVEVEEPDAGGLERASAADVVVRARQSFAQALDKVQPLASAIVKTVTAMSDPPDELQVEFGLKLSAEAGVILTCAGMEANYTLTLTWRREQTTARAG
jgi:hypothetical protein